MALTPVLLGERLAGEVSAGKPPSSPSLEGVPFAARCGANGGDCLALLRRSNSIFPIGGLAVNRTWFDIMEYSPNKSLLFKHIFWARGGTVGNSGPHLDLLRPPRWNVPEKRSIFSWWLSHDCVDWQAPSCMGLA